MMRVDEEVEDVEGRELSEALVLHRTDLKLVLECSNVPENPFFDTSLKMTNFSGLSQLQ